MTAVRSSEDGWEQEDITESQQGRIKLPHGARLVILIPPPARTRAEKIARELEAWRAGGIAQSTRELHIMAARELRRLDHAAETRKLKGRK